MPNNSSQLYATCTIFDDPEQCDTVITIRKATAAFSLVGCIFMVFVIWLFKKYKVFAQRLILYLTIAAFCDSIAYLMSSRIEDGRLCDFQAWWLTYFDWSVLLCISCVTLNLFINVILVRTTEQYEKYYLIVCLFLPVLMSALPFIGDHYGPAGAWCWITDDIGWRLGIWYVPLFVTIVILFIAYIYIKVKLWRQATTWEGTYSPDREREHKMLMEDIKPLQYYPCVYLVISLFPLINRIQNAMSPDHAVYWLVIMASLTAPLHGILNAFVFGMDKETMKKLTPSQIKISLLAKFAPATPVQEYPQLTTSEQTLGNTDILQQDAEQGNPGALGQ